MNRPNLTVIKTSLVSQIVIENGNAIGLEVSGDGTPRTITCERDAGLHQHLR